MTLPSSGPMTLEMIRVEFGGGHPIQLSNYYAGGPYVPPGTSGVNGPIPSGGGISLWHFYGATKGISIHNLVAANGLGRFDGYNNYGGLVMGSFSPVGLPFFGGAACVTLYQDNAGPSNVVFAVAGNQPNSNWNTFTISGMPTVFQRALASYMQSGPPAVTSWTWYLGPGEDYFTPGNSYTVVFT